MNKVRIRAEDGDVTVEVDGVAMKNLVGYSIGHTVESRVPTLTLDFGMVELDMEADAEVVRATQETVTLRTMGEPDQELPR